MQRNTLNVMKHMPDETKNTRNLRDAACPIFERVKSRKLRALMMVACGCDVYPTGIEGVRPKKLKSLYLDKIKKQKPSCAECETELYEALFEMVVKDTKLSANAIDTFVKALLYQPTNYQACEIMPTATETTPKESTCDQYTYIDNHPDVLPSYLFEEFAQPGVTTIDGQGPEVSICVGADGHTRNFLSEMGSKQCHGCNGIICEKCTEEVMNKPYSLSCSTGELLIPSSDDSYTERISFMRNELKHQYKWDNADEMAVDQVEAAYDAAIKPYRDKMELVEQVKFPLYRTSELKDPTKWKQISDIHFCNGGTFIADPLLGAHVPALLELFASFVKYQDMKTDHLEWMKECGVYDALPEMIINFAKNSRVESGEGTGFRLLQRCVRHGHDPKMPSLFHNKASIIQLEECGSLGLVINAKVPASMQTATYKTTTAHTATDHLLAVERECKRGSTAKPESFSNENDVTCVHNPVLPYGVTKLMYEALAEQILIELTSCIALLYASWTNNTEREHHRTGGGSRGVSC